MNIDLTVDDLHNFDNLDAVSRKIMQDLKEIGRDRVKGHGGVKLDDLKVVAGALGINKCQRKEILVDLILLEWLIRISYWKFIKAVLRKMIIRALDC
jgi:hypothetical protein